MINQTDNEAELHFWVRDSGIGMPPEQCGAGETKCDLKAIESQALPL